jgi:cell wall-associated NlpC family hydrolase
MPRRSHRPHRSVAPGRRRHLILALTAGLAATTSLVVVAPAQGTTPQEQLAAKRAQAEHLNAQIQANYARADQLDEQLVQAKTAVADAQGKIDAAEAGIAQAEQNATNIRSKLGLRAATLYMGAGNNDPFQINATDVRELGSRAKYTEAAAAQDSSLIDQLRVTEEQLGIQRADLQTQKHAAESKQHDFEKARKELDATTANQTQLLGSIKGQMATLVNQVNVERQRQEEAAARARFAAQQAAAQQAAAVNNGGGGGGSGGAGITVDPSTIPAPSAGAAAAVAYAYAQVGKPYIYAGTGPAGYDCSGLTMMAWAQGGVSMAHGSQAQYMAFPKVPISQLQPGDLVFFGDSGPSNHHVGIVVGPGTMIEAPHTGAFVRVTSYYRSDLVPLGVRP